MADISSRGGHPAAEPLLRDTETLVGQHVFDPALQQCSCGWDSTIAEEGFTYATHLTLLLQPSLATAYAEGHEDGFWDGKTTQLGVKDSLDRNPYARDRPDAPDEAAASALPTRGGAVVQYWGADGTPFLAYLGTDMSLESIWWVQRMDARRAERALPMTASDLTTHTRGRFQVLPGLDSADLRARIYAAGLAVTGMHVPSAVVNGLIDDLQAGLKGGQQ